jgi:UDP-glucose 4-epimerase
VTGSTNIALAAEAVGAKVVYASTWEVYGDPVYEPVDEKHPCEPDHPYNITKLAGERMLIAADRLRGVPVTALRLGTAYGLGMRPNSVFEIFINKALHGEPITIQGDGSQGRQFTHASDIARAFVAAAKSDARGMALNVVSSEVISIKQLAELVTERFPTEVTYGQARPGDVAPSYVSAARIEEVLGWKAEMSFEDGLAELLSVDRG